MDTVQLKRIIASDSEMKEYCLGVFPSNGIPTGRVGGMIVNEDTSTQPGSHWVGIFIHQNNEAEHFDSYGRHVTGPIAHVLKQFDVTRNDVQVQAPLSSCCGQHTVYYLYHRCRDVPFMDIVESYSKDLAANDEMVTQFVNQEFNMDEPTSDFEFLQTQISRALQSSL